MSERLAEREGGVPEFESKMTLDDERIHGEYCAHRFGIPSDDLIVCLSSTPHGAGCTSSIGGNRNGLVFGSS